MHRCATTSRCRRPSSTGWSSSRWTHGAVGARLTGAGFGGCIVALVEPRRAETFAAAWPTATVPKPAYEPTAFSVRAVDGAGIVNVR